MNTMHRRTFSAAAFTALSYSRIPGANGRLQIGYIGVGNRGDQVHDAFTNHPSANKFPHYTYRAPYKLG